MFVDFNDVASGVCAARETSETFGLPSDDRVRISAGLDDVTVFDLLVEEGVEGVPAPACRIDVTHEREYRKPSFSADTKRLRPWRRPRGAHPGGWVPALIVPIVAASECARVFGLGVHGFGGKSRTAPRCCFVLGSALMTATRR
jgi:hypothetical protein